MLALVHAGGRALGAAKRELRVDNGHLAELRGIMKSAKNRAQAHEPDL
eukprot:SAG22_NODE_626_length_8433_cov_43.291097_3_plen_48_part_00